MKNPIIIKTDKNTIWPLEYQIPYIEFKKWWAQQSIYTLQNVEPNPLTLSAMFLENSYQLHPKRITDIENLSHIEVIKFSISHPALMKTFSDHHIHIHIDPTMPEDIILAKHPEISIEEISKLWDDHSQQIKEYESYKAQMLKLKELILTQGSKHGEIVTYPENKIHFQFNPKAGSFDLIVPVDGKFSFNRDTPFPLSSKLKIRLNTTMLQSLARNPESILERLEMLVNNETEFALNDLLYDLKNQILEQFKENIAEAIGELVAKLGIKIPELDNEGV